MSASTKINGMYAAKMGCKTVRLTVTLLTDDTIQIYQTASVAGCVPLLQHHVQWPPIEPVSDGCYAGEVHTCQVFGSLFSRKAFLRKVEFVSDRQMRLSPGSDTPIMFARPRHRQP